MKQFILRMLVLTLLAVGIAACSTDGGDNEGEPNDTSDTGADGDADADSDTDSPNLEICNGIDDDNNGIIDDVDVGGDGICDCLNIATVGEPGVWGDGNIFSDWLTERSSTAVVNLGDAVLTDSLLAPLQVIVFLNVGEGEDGINRQYDSEEVDALSRWVASGGGIMTTIGYASYREEVDNINRLLAPYDIYYDSAAVLQKQGDQTVPITEWVAHDTTDGVTAVGVDNGYEVMGTPAALAQEQGIVMARATGYEEGNVFVWGDEWICYDSEWENITDYQIERFWLNIIKWLTPEDECQVAIPPVL